MGRNQLILLNAPWPESTRTEKTLMRHVLITAVVLVMTTLQAQHVSAQQPVVESEPAARSIPEEDLNQSQHSVRIGGEEVRYTATAGTILLRDEAGAPKADAFFVAYTRDGVGSQSGLQWG